MVVRGQSAPLKQRKFAREYHFYYASVWAVVSLRFLCSFTFCMMLMVRKGTRNIAMKTRVSITIDKSIVVVFNWLITGWLIDRCAVRTRFRADRPLHCPNVLATSAKVFPNLCKGAARSKEFLYSCSLTLARFLGFLQRRPFICCLLLNQSDSRRRSVSERNARSDSAMRGPLPKTMEWKRNVVFL